MTKKQKNNLIRILVAAVLMGALLVAEHVLQPGHTLPVRLLWKKGQQQVQAPTAVEQWRQVGRLSGT
ncbi:MAG: hypothetical protein IIZ34_04920 [Eubacterium sp.]|nr:hypothetical protein [Eubacterium sp.]